MKYRLTLEMDASELAFVSEEGYTGSTYEIIGLMRDYAEATPDSLERIPGGGEGQDVLPLPQP